MRIQFKAKPRTDAAGRQFVKMPALTRRHCDMAAFRKSRRFGSYANSDLFPAILRREMNRLEIPERLIIGSESLYYFGRVTIDASQFLAVVTINVPDSLTDPVSAS